VRGIEQPLAFQVRARERQAGAGREHRRPDLQQADARRVGQPGPAAAAAVGERRQQERIAVRLRGDLAHDARNLGQALVARHLAAHPDDRGVEARGVDRAGDGRRFGGPAARVLELVDAALRRDGGRALAQSRDGAGGRLGGRRGRDRRARARIGVRQLGGQQGEDERGDGREHPCTGVSHR
jgi:hypothetical protein